MSNVEKIVINDSSENTHVQLLLLEQNIKFIQQTLDKVDKKIDAIEKKINKVEYNIYSNLRWIVGISMPALFAIYSIIAETYQYMNK